MGNPILDLAPKVGTGDCRQAEFYTFGVLRWTIDPRSGAWVSQSVTEPTAATTRPQFFTRMSGGQWQLCVRFPTGATQILATEP